LVSFILFLLLLFVFLLLSKYHVGQVKLISSSSHQEVT